MAQDPRSMLQENCVGTSAAPRAVRQAEARRAQAAAGVLYDNRINQQFTAEALSRASNAQLDAIGGIQAGIESLVRLSNEIRGTGRGGRRTTIGGIVGRVISENGAVESGANAILQGMGIGRNITSVVNGLIPANVDKAFATACRVFELVRSGSFFGGVINDVLPDFLQVQRDIVKSPAVTRDEVNGKFEGCFASPYATDLIKRAPKFKFQFVVEFEWNASYLGDRTVAENHIAFVVKNTTRPNIRYDYEDINMYNFRTKAIKRMEYEPMTMKFHDDDENNAMRFVNRYYKAMSPIGNLPKGRDKTTKDSVNGASVGLSTELQEDGMAFGDGALVCQQYSASVGPLTGLGAGSSNDTRQPLKRITIYHVFDQGRKVNVYTMYNPKITDLQLDELDHSIGTEGTEVGLTFTYDALTMVTAASFDPNADGYNIKELEIDAGAQWPLRYVDHPNNAPSKQEGLGDLFDCPSASGTTVTGGGSFASNFGSNSLPSSLLNVGGLPGDLGSDLSSLSSQLSPQTLQRSFDNLNLQLPSVGETFGEVGSQISRGVAPALSNISNNQYVARAQDALNQVNLQQAQGATETLVDGAMVSIQQAKQIYGGKLQKALRLAQNQTISKTEVDLIDRAAGIKSEVEGLFT